MSTNRKEMKDMSSMQKGSLCTKNFLTGKKLGVFGMRMKVYVLKLT